MNENENSGDGWNGSGIGNGDDGWSGNGIDDEKIDDDEKIANESACALCIRIFGDRFYFFARLGLSLKIKQLINIIGNELNEKNQLDNK